LKGREYLPQFARAVGNYFRCANIPLVVSNACISGLLAMIIAKRFIQSGNYDEIIVCGADLVTAFTLSGFRSFNALSPGPCRPFDADRAGINLGEAAASVHISARESEICFAAGASANDANHISGPSRAGDGLFQAVSQTMATQKLPSFISAHGTATEYNDEMESAAFFRAGISDLPVNSLKGYYGHTLGAAGVLESILSVQAMKKNVLIRSQGYGKKGTTHLNHVITETISAEVKSCIKTTSGFGGCNAAALYIKTA
jgi:3-oxoacyl-[acyl-carrier-protein] synthase-1